jgi:hypothetical protein
MRAIKNISYVLPHASKEYHQPLPAETLKLLKKIFSAKNQGRPPHLESSKVNAIS